MFIAEIGINHDGELNKAKALILIAKESGADIVKFQKRNPEICIPESQKSLTKDTIYGIMNYGDYKKKIEFGKKEYDEIDRYCKKINIPWTASVWDIDSYYFIQQYDVPFIKIPSAMITNIPLLTEISTGFHDVILSTGMSTEREIGKAVDTLGINRIKAILHCTSAYPSNHKDINLNYINTLRKYFPTVSIGYSGHEQGILPTLIAVSMGVDIIERHITYNTYAKGTDHRSSLSFQELKELIKLIEEVKIIQGMNKKIISNDELLIKEKLRG